MYIQRKWASFSTITRLMAIALIMAVTVGGAGQAWAVSSPDRPQATNERLLSAADDGQEYGTDRPDTPGARASDPSAEVGSTEPGQVLAAKYSRQELPEITIEASRADYVAGLGPLTFTLTREGDTSSELDVTVDIVQDETWLSSTSSAVAFNAGAATTTLIFPAAHFSSDVTQSGTLTATVAAVTGYDTSGATVSVNVISQEGPAVTVAFEESEYTVTEDAGSLEVVLVARAATGILYVDEFAVSVSTKSLGATSTLDYVNYNDNITFGPTDFAEVDGSLVATTTLVLTILDDDFIEDNEQFGLELSTPAGTSNEVAILDPNGDSCNRPCPDLYLVTILDDDGPQIAIEANRSNYVAGLGSLVFTLSREGDTSSALDVTVDITQDENWLSSTSHDVTFGAGEAATTLTFRHSAFSSDVTQSGTLTATVAAVSRYNTIGATVTVNVISQEGPAVTVSFEESEYSVAEDAGEFRPVLVARAAAGVPYVDGVRLTVVTSADEATSPEDFGDYSKILTFVPTDFTEVDGFLVATTTLVITIVDDETYEEDEQFGLVLEGTPDKSKEVGLLAPNGDLCATVCGNHYPVTIVDNDGNAVTVSYEQPSYSVAEGKAVTIKVVLSEDPERQVTVPITVTELGGATFSDYSGNYDWLVFKPGDTYKTFTIRAFQDFDNDDGESLLLGFRDLPAGVTIDMYATTTVAIIDDDDGDPDYNLGTLGAFWTHTDDAISGNLLPIGECHGRGTFRIIWDAREDGRGADEWAAHVTIYGGMSGVSYSFRESSNTYPPGSYEMNGRVNIEGEGHLTIRVRGRFDDTWGTWSPPVGLYCQEEQE